MATTDARTGFRLPWSSDQRPATDETGAADGSEPDSGRRWGADAAAATSASGATDWPANDTRPGAARADGYAGESGSGPDGDDDGPGRGGRGRPSKFLADLTKAMQVTAETAREETLGRLSADAKSHIEEIHARSATESNDLRRRADDDVASIREWSKAEIARIREETETRIAERKARLEMEIQEHAGLIERQIERVQGRVSGFEAEMADFFERLLAEEDPTRFASMAENLPEPPPFDLSDWPALPAHEKTTFESLRTAQPVVTEEHRDATADRGWGGTSQAERETNADDAERAMAAIQAAAEAATESESGAFDADTFSSDGYAAPASNGFDTPAPDADSPRAFDVAPASFEDGNGSADLAAAEAEAFAAGDDGEEIEIPTIGDDALAARLAGLVPSASDDAPAENQSTQVVVTGLVSVASIASFKRHLGRVTGVQSVGVSSGPDGEFVFAVAHGPNVSLVDAVPSLPGFQARVNGASAGVIEVTAHDPESEA